MNLLLLSGASVRNKKWIEEVGVSCKLNFDKTYIQNYLHWKNNVGEFNLDIELIELQKVASSYEPYAVFAKSAGSILACAAISKGILKPERCVFAGFPLVMVTNQNLPADDWLSNINYPVTIIQNELDPLGSFEDVSNFIAGAKNANIKIYKLPGDTHDYKDILKLKEFIAS